MTDPNTLFPQQELTVSKTFRLAEVQVPDNAIRCACGEWWTALAAAHRAGCHRTFTSVSGFTAHRKAGKCIDPIELGMVRAERKYEAWAMPGTWAGPEDGVA